MAVKAENEQIESADRFEAVLQIIFLIIFGLVVYAGGIVLLFIPIVYLTAFSLNLLLALITLILEIVWIVKVKRWHPKNPQIQILRKLLFVAVFTLLASVLTLLFICWVLSQFTW